MGNAIRFILNDDEVVITDLPNTQTLLDLLRLEKRLKGTKEGCAEGDCGACTVLVGRLLGDELVYESVNACICFTASLHGMHVVTIEHISRADGPLHPVQTAMVEHHGSQCGFCTPGIVMSLYGLWMRDANPTRASVEEALQGNLCRCTGYAPIIRAAAAISDYGTAADDPLVTQRAKMKDRLRAIDDGESVRIGDGRAGIIIPATIEDLAEAFAAHPSATLVSGATDVGLWVTKFMRDLGPMIFIGGVADLHRMERDDEALRLGAGVTYAEAAPVIRRTFPQLAELWSRIGGSQVRNRGTVGGNIANGSPIGDTPPALIALGASIVLRKGKARREVKLEDYFLAYGKQDRLPGEFVESVIIPTLPSGERLAVYKVSKRRDEDISSVCGAFRLGLENGVVATATVAFGGMAATPKRARAVEAALVGRAWTASTVESALPSFAEDYRPLTDMRASAEYRLLVAGNLLRRFYRETNGEAVRLETGVA